MPKVSIISPIHNPGKYLRPLLESLIHQTFQDIEILLIDDGSTDGSRDILMEYAEKDQRVRVFFREKSSEERFGEKASVDLGRQIAQGSYIMLVDHDDELALGAIETLYKYTNDETIDVVQGRNITIDEDGKMVYATEDIYPEPTIIYNVNELNDIDIMQHLTCNPVALWTCLIRKDFQKDLELGDYIFNDTDFIWKLKLTAQTFCYIPEYIYKQNQHKDSVSGANFTYIHAFDIFESFDNLERFLKYMEVPYRIWTCFAIYRFRMCYGHLSGIKDPEAFNRFKSILKNNIKRDGNYSHIINVLFDNEGKIGYKELLE